MDSDYTSSLKTSSKGSNISVTVNQSLNNNLESNTNKSTHEDLSKLTPGVEDIFDYATTIVLTAVKTLLSNSVCLVQLICCTVLFYFSDPHYFYNFTNMNHC